MLPELVTPRLVLRNWSPALWPDFLRLLGDAGFRSYSNLGTLSPKATEQMYRDRMCVGDGPFGFWAVLQEGKAIGSIQVWKQHLDGEPETLVEMGYRLKESAWGQGLASEAGLAVLGYADGLGLESLVAFVEESNVRSRRVVEKLGFELWRTGLFKGVEVNVMRFELS